MSNKIRKEQIEDGGDILFGIPSSSVGVTELSASGTPSSSTYLRGDNTWGTPSGSGNVDSVNGATGTVVLDADDIDDTSTTNKFTTSGDITKLAGIETSADVTDTTNVTSAGALMDSELADISAIKTLQAPDNTTISTFGAELIDDADASTARTTLGLAIGTNVQAFNSNLTTYAGIAPSANVQSLLGSADYSAMRTLLSLVPGTNVQAYDADLATIAGLTATTDNFIVSVASAWASRTPSQVRTTLGLVIGTNVQAWDAQLDTWATVTPSANGQSLVASANYASMRGLLDLEAGTDFYSISATDTLLNAKAPLASPSFTGTVTLPTGLTGALRADSGVVSVDGTVIRKVKSSDEIVNNSSTLQNDNDLFFSVGANEIWAVRLFIRYNSGTTPDIKFQFSLPSGATASMGSQPHYDNTNFTGASSVLVSGAGSTRSAIFQGYVETAGTAGTATLQWAQNTADPSDTTVFTYSYLIAEKIA